jgi:hypothetical protein
MRKLLLAILLVATLPVVAQHKQGVDSLQWYKRRCDTLMHQKYTASYKYNMLHRYAKIIIKRPKSVQYLSSWLRNVDAVKE